MVCAGDGPRPCALKLEEGLRKHPLFRCVILIPVHEADGGIEKDVGTFRRF